MADDKIRLIRARNAQRGSFKRQGLSRKLRLEDTWRRPRGIQSKQRKDYRAKGRHPQSGFGSPKAVRYFHPSGFEEVISRDAPQTRKSGRNQAEKRNKKNQRTPSYI